MHKAQSLINHVAIVTDASYSMNHLQSTVRSVLDAQIENLNQLSAQYNQETRVSVYRFGQQTIECLIFDMDVARLPSSAELYSVLRENTALVDAFLKSQDDLKTTSTLYGDHAFLTFVLTDGQENASRNPKSKLRDRVFAAPENWSVGFLVPDRAGVNDMERLGVLKDSVAIWDISSAKGLLDAGAKMREATSNFMVARAAGVRGTRSVFSTGLDAVNKQTVRGNLDELRAGSFSIYDVKVRNRIDDFVVSQGMYYVKGKAYYQLTKTENIQGQKDVVVVEKKTGKAYSGPEARHILGLPDGMTVRVAPNSNPDYDVFIQSTSYNRVVLPFTKVLVTA